MVERVGNQIMQVFVEDHVSPFMNAIGDMHLKVGRVKDACPPLPERSVKVVQGIGPGGPYIKMLPTADLMAWMSCVMQLADVGSIPADGPLRREAVASHDGSIGYTERPQGDGFKLSRARLDAQVREEQVARHQVDPE